MRKLILASASPRRKVLLKRIVPHFRVIEPGVREIHYRKKPPAESAELNAFRKARDIAKAEPKALVIGADTIVVLGQKILGKPRTLREAYKMLEALSGRVHRVITGVAVLRGERSVVFHVTTKVRMRKLSPERIAEYCRRVHVLDKAGAYGIQESPKIVAGTQGSRSNVIGLPLERLKRALLEIQ